MRNHSNQSLRMPNTNFYPPSYSINTVSNYESNDLKLNAENIAYKNLWFGFSCFMILTIKLKHYRQFPKIFDHFMARGHLIWTKFGIVVGPIEVLHTINFFVKIPKIAYFKGAQSFDFFSIFEGPTHLQSRITLV